MRPWHWRWLACVACASLLVACGDDSSGPKDGITPPKRDSGADSGPNSGRGTGGKKAPPTKIKDSGASDSGEDGAVVDPWAFDANGDYRDGAVVNEPPEPVPDAWKCPAALWNDGYCDCGCFATDGDCSQSSCSTLTGCDTQYCTACFTPTGAWTPCTPPDPLKWTCGEGAKFNSQCDCGCGIPDPECNGQGCSEPGCLVAECSLRHGCDPGNITAVGDDCSGTNVPANWKCAGGSYGSGDGCDCGCGEIDPDCGGKVSCTGSRCYASACQLCHAGENPRGPYSCDAAKAGWDDDIGSASGSQPSLCNGTRFGADDGCDCGCGGVDPDCGTEGTPIPGATDPACARCTEPGPSLKVIGCGVPSAWSNSSCNPANFGTGDGCDCGCGTPDPDCDALGKAGSTVPGADDASCDVCNDGAGGFNPCPGWTCTNAAAITTGDCDCGCGVIDPACRLNGWLSCTDAGCSTAACKYTNDGATRTGPIASGWQAGGDSCSLYQYGVDGLCDCGCGVHDPDCEVDQDCTEKGCFAPGCEVCHDGSLLAVCYANRCDATAMTDTECDCGCGAPDPACGFAAGCTQPGCKDAACTVCHDPFGRPVPCP